MTKTRWTLLAAGAVVAGGLATVALAGDGKWGGRRGAWRERAQRIQRWEKWKAAKAERAEFVESLGVTDAQRQLVLDKARAAAPVVETARAEARRIVAGALAQAAKDEKADRTALRAQVREQLRALRERTAAQLEPLAKELVAGLTAEQRQKIQERAASKGRTADDAKLAKYFTAVISRPMTVPYLEARLSAATPR